jgi:hypothetical protein
MKKDIIITFDIYQDSLDNQKPDFTIYSELLPKNLNSFSQEELNKSGLNKMIKPLEEKKDMTEHLGRTYTYRITEKQLKDFLSKINKG